MLSREDGHHAGYADPNGGLRCATERVRRRCRSDFRESPRHRWRPKVYERQIRVGENQRVHGQRAGGVTRTGHDHRRLGRKLWRAGHVDESSVRGTRDAVRRDATADCSLLNALAFGSVAA